MSATEWTHRQAAIEVLIPGDAGSPLVVLIGQWNARFDYRHLIERLPAGAGVAVATLPAGNRFLGLEVLRDFDGSAAFIVSSDVVTNALEDGRPLVVMGSSRAGHVAHEVARSLAETGRPVALEVLVDTIYPGREVTVREGRARKRRAKYRKIWESRDVARLLREIVRKAGDRCMLAFRRVQTAIHVLLTDEVPATAVAAPPDPLLEAGYTPAPVGHPVVYYRASQTAPADSTVAWREAAPHLIEVVVDGTHGGQESVLQADRVEMMAVDLAERLAKCS